MFDEVGGPALYAGGSFTIAGGMIANRIARWNGSSWSALGSGMGGSSPIVHALTVFDDGGGPALYAGGEFSTAGGASASRIAKWNGSSWSALGSGINDDVRTLTVLDDGSGPALYAGGSFAIAGGHVSACIAPWVCTETPPPDITWSPSVQQNRSLSFTTQDPATATGAAGTTAIKVVIVDLEYPDPPNNNPAGPCCPPGNFVGFDTAVNSVCAGGNDQGYRCPPSTCPDSTCPAGVGCSEAAGANAQGSCARWVAPPLGYLESNDNPGLGNYRVSRLQCTPYYHDWASEPNAGLVNVIGAEVVPQLHVRGNAVCGELQG
jgi:hypothetical protein